MTCDDQNNPSSKGFPPSNDLKRPLDSNEDQLSEKRMKTLITDSKSTKNTQDLVHFNNENDAKIMRKSRKLVPKHARRRKRRLEIETEFKILQSLIPKVANKQPINELEIIDACVNYIEALQEQLNIRNPEEHNNSTEDTENDENTMSTSIRSLMNAIAEDQVEDRLHSVQDDEMDDYLNSASSEEDYTEDEVEEDSNNNNEDITSKDINKVEENIKHAIDSSKDNTKKTQSYKDDITDKDSSRS